MVFEYSQDWLRFLAQQQLGRSLTDRRFEYTRKIRGMLLVTGSVVAAS
jgi:hypothetical protein